MSFYQNQSPVTSHQSSTLKVSILLLLFLLPIASLFAQYDTLNLVQVNGRILEQMNGSMQSLPNVSLKVKGIGKFKTDDSGSFVFQVAIYDYNRFDAQIEVEISVDGYDIISPLDGIIEMDTTDFRMSLDLVVIGDNLSETYLAQVTNLNKRLQRLKRENSLSAGRLNAINDSLLNSIKQGEYKRQTLKNTIANLNTDLASATAGNESLKNQLASNQQALDQLNNSVVELNNKYLEAMEEKYLRQQKYYKAISADLADYLIRAKDVHELLEHVKEYFPTSGNPNYATSYNSSLTAYNVILTKINEQHNDYVQSVKRYWPSPTIALQLEETFQILFNQLHYPKLQPSLVAVNGFIRKRKVNKAGNVAHTAFHDMYPIILNLEKSINKTSKMLKDNL